MRRLACRVVGLKKFILFYFLILSWSEYFLLQEQGLRDFPGRGVLTKPVCSILPCVISTGGRIRGSQGTLTAYMHNYGCGDLMEILQGFFTRCVNLSPSPSRVCGRAGVVNNVNNAVGRWGSTAAPGTAAGGSKGGQLRALGMGKSCTRSGVIPTHSMQ